MGTLEKILEEIKAASRKMVTIKLPLKYYRAIGTRKAEEIIRKHLKNDGWIPVEERMPDPEEDVGALIVTERNGNVWGDIYYGYANETDEEPCFHNWDDEMWRCFKPDVIAWRHMPEPYRAERK